MGRFKLFNMESYLVLDATGSGNCLLCDKTLKAHIGNIKRHYLVMHNKNISRLMHNRNNISREEESFAYSSQSPYKKRKAQNVTLKMDKGEYKKCIVKLIAEMDMPLRNFDNDAFQNLLQPWTDGFGVKYNSKSIGEALNEMANSLRLEIMKSVSKKYICLKLDIASRMDRSILGINIQFIDQNFKVVVFTIGMVELLERHHSSYLKQAILDMLDKFGIHSNQIYSVTTDNGANVIKTSKLLQEFNENDTEHNENFNEDLFNQVSRGISECFSSATHCAAHTLQLAAWDVIKLLKEKISNCRENAKFIRKKMRELKGGPLPVLDNSSRWSSTFEMVNSLMEAKAWVDSNNMFTIEVDWEFVKQFTNSFKPIANVTTLLQYKQLIMGDFYRDLLLCEIELEEISNTSSIAASLLEALKKRKDILVQNKAFLAAIYMDPRFCFKGSIFLSEDQKKDAMLHLLTIYNRLKKTGEINENIIDEFSINHEVLEIDSFEDCYQKLELKATLNTLKQRTFSVKESLEQLQYDSKLPFGTNILEFWKIKKLEAPTISKIAQVALAVPATQVSVERAFSALPVILTKNRRNLTAEDLENILLLKLNTSLIAKISI